MNRVLLVTATKVEAKAVLELVPEASGVKWKRRPIKRKTYYALGEVGGVDVVMVQSEAGSVVPGGSLITVDKAIEALSPAAVILVGIAFGTGRGGQKIGDVLVSKQVQAYEPQKVAQTVPHPRGDRVTASTYLLDKFRSGDNDWKGVPTHFGLILTGEKLINDARFLKKLVKLEPEAIGGEMEGAGLYVAASEAKVDWIIIKSICDWADGTKSDEHQKAAARNAVAFTLHVIRQGGLSLASSPMDSGSHASRDEPPPDVCPLIPSTIPAFDRPFVGRDKELAQILAILGDTSREKVVVLHGKSGAGKSELGCEFARIQRSRYPGGIFFIRAGSGGAAVDLAGIGKNILGLQFAPEIKLDDQAQQTLHRLASAPTLLEFDNVTSLGDIEGWLPHSGVPCHVIITTVIAGSEIRWPAVHVLPLSDKKSLELVEALGGTEVARKYGQRLVELSGGLPIQICPTAAALKQQHKRGLDRYFDLTLADEAKTSFGNVYRLLDDQQKRLVHAAAHLNPQRIGREELFLHLREPAGMTDTQLARVLGTCMDLHLLEGREDLRMHQLLASFLLGIRLEGDLAVTFGGVREAQARRFIELAAAVALSPADPNLVAAFMTYRLEPDAWDEMTTVITGGENHGIGMALSKIGRWTDALPWFERAVEAAEQGDVHGRVDHESLGTSLHQLGICYANLGKFEDALAWFERAVEAKRKGNIYGKADEESLQVSLDALSSCSK